MYLGMMPFNGQMLTALFQTNQDFFENAFAFNQEVVGFAHERLRAELEVLQTLPRCTSWESIVEFQSDFVQSVSEAYHAEIPKLMDQAIHAAAALWQPIYESAKALPQGFTKT